MAITSSGMAPDTGGMQRRSQLTDQYRGYLNSPSAPSTAGAGGAPYRTESRPSNGSFYGGSGMGGGTPNSGSFYGGLSSSQLPGSNGRRPPQWASQLQQPAPQAAPPPAQQPAQQPTVQPAMQAYEPPPTTTTVAGRPPAPSYSQADVTAYMNALYKWQQDRAAATAAGNMVTAVEFPQIDEWMRQQGAPVDQRAATLPAPPQSGGAGTAIPSGPVNAPNPIYESPPIIQQPVSSGPYTTGQEHTGQPVFTEGNQPPRSTATPGNTSTWPGQLPPPPTGQIRGAIGQPQAGNQAPQPAPAPRPRSSNPQPAPPPQLPQIGSRRGPSGPSQSGPIAGTIYDRPQISAMQRAAQAISSGVPRFAYGTDNSQQYANAGMSNAWIPSSGNSYLQGRELPPAIQALVNAGMPVPPAVVDAATGRQSAPLNMASAYTQRGGGSLPSYQGYSRMSPDEQQAWGGFVQGPVGMPESSVVDFLSRPTQNLQRAPVSRMA